MGKQPIISLDDCMLHVTRRVLQLSTKGTRTRLMMGIHHVCSHRTAGWLSCWYIIINIPDRRLLSSWMAFSQLLRHVEKSYSFSKKNKDKPSSVSKMKLDKIFYSR